MRLETELLASQPSIPALMSIEVYAHRGTYSVLHPLFSSQMALSLDDAENFPLCAASQPDKPDIVKLNVGGVLFTTSRSTLTRFPNSYCTSYDSGKHSDCLRLKDSLRANFPPLKIYAQTHTRSCPQ